MDVELGMSGPTFEKAELKKEIILSAEKVILVADSSKFNRRSINKICSLQDFSLIISDKGVDAETVQRLQEKGVALQLV